MCLVYSGTHVPGCTDHDCAPSDVVVDVDVDVVVVVVVVVVVSVSVSV